MKKITLLLSSALVCITCFAQEKDEPKSLLSLTAGGGVLTFNGDIGKGKDVSAYTYIRSGIYLNVEKRFSKDWLGASITLMNGKLAMGERSVIVHRNNNFESKLTQAGINITGYLQNNKDIPIIPFFTTGFAYTMLNTKADLKYNGDSLYYYWSDGSIRNLPELPGNEIISKHISRDYVYETTIDSAAKSTLAIPLGIGIKMNLHKKIEANLGINYHLTLSDGIDALKGSGKDQYLFSYFSLTYNFIKDNKTSKSKEKSNVDFASIDNQDADKDGVKDDEDACPGTPKEAQVDSKGCPVDSDDDGIPDYRDQEKNTKKGALVDADGKTITDAMIREKARQDSLTEGRYNTFMNEPSSVALKELDSDIQKSKAGKSNSNSNIPPLFRSADTNKDGIISSSEISAVIDGFFEGSNDYTVEKIHSLIDYFFEQ